MPKIACPASCQIASNAFMELRALCASVEFHALEALSKARLAKSAMMAAAPTVLGADSGAHEELLIDIAKVRSTCLRMHSLASDFMRRNNFELPVAPPYNDEYETPDTVTVQLKVAERR